MKHYNYFRSSTSHRLRIALNLKAVQPEYVPVDLLHGAHLDAEFQRVNPQGLVPALVLDDGEVLTQSPAIIEWLEERYPTPALLPTNVQARAHVRALAAVIGCDTHPLQNRRVLVYLREVLGHNEDAVQQWCRHWISTSLAAYEALLAGQKQPGRFSWGDSPTLADVYLVPQVESARRFKVDLAAYPRISAIDAACAELPAFAQASPWAQPDAPAQPT